MTAISLAAAVNDADDAAGTAQLYDAAAAVNDANDAAAQLHDAAWDDAAGGQWRLIPNTADDRTTPVEGIGRGRKRGWSVVCEYLRASQRVQSPAGQQFFFYFFLSPNTMWPTSLGSVIVGG